MIYGYARMSPDDPDLELTVAILKGAGCQKIYVDGDTSNVALEKGGLSKCLKVLTAGDTLVVSKIEQIGYDIGGLFRLLEKLQKTGVVFQSLKENIVSDKPLGITLWDVASAFAQLDKALLVERTRAGVKKAQERGVKFGRREKLTPKQIEEAQKMIKSGKRVVDVAKHFNVDRATIYRKLNIDALTKRSHGYDH